jgi:circadian clock protein KaiC
MVLGPSGAGKTSLGLHFMSACTRAQPGVYLSFY